MIDVPIAHVSVQLPIAEVVAQTVPSIWEGYDGPEEARQIVDRMHPGDRMMLAIRLAAEAGCPATAAIVAATLAYRGWISWPSQEAIHQETGIAQPHVSRAVRQLAEAGLIRHYVLRRGRKNVASVYSWVHTNLVSGSYQIGIWEPEGNQKEEQELIDQSVPVPNSGSNPGHPRARETYQIGMSEDESTYQIGMSEDESTYQIGMSEDESTYQIGMNPPPRWWVSFVRRWDPAPSWTVASEHAALAGWSEDHLYRAAQQMSRTYMGVTVSDPDQLLRTIAASIPPRPR